MPRRALMAVALAALSFAPAACGGSAAPEATIETISPADAAALVAEAPAGLVVLDVRTPEEFATGHLAGAVNLDYSASTFAADLADLDRDVPYLLYCRSGNRSAAAREQMRDLGFAEVYEIAGGVGAWVEQGFDIVAP